MELDTRQYSPHKRTCEECGKEFFPRQGNLHKNSCCSRQCAWKKRKRTNPPNYLKKCSVPGCNRNRFIKEFCCRHYANFLRNGSPYPKTIIGYREVRNCSCCGIKFMVRPSSKNKYCSPSCGHKMAGLSKVGIKNPRWNNGNSEYINHSLMKKNRILRMQQELGKCEICKKSAEIIHHKDEDKSNHCLNNLMVLCRKCHYAIHIGRRSKTSKFIRLYGMTLRTMAERLGGDEFLYYRLHKQKKLKNYLINSLDNKKDICHT